jgi:hypothetical protein
MTFPLGLWDVSLFLAITATILLITSELLAPQYGRTNLKISRKNLKNAALTISVLFLATVAMKIVSIIIYG